MGGKPNPKNENADLFPNLRYDIRVADGYGSKENETHWNGMVGLVSRQVRDIPGEHHRYSLTCSKLIKLTSKRKKSNIFFTFQEKDLAVAALTISSQREEVVDFTVPFHDEVATVVLKVNTSLIE